MPLTIDFFLLGLNHPAVNAWFRGMYDSFFDALRDLGCHVTYSDNEPNISADVLVVPTGGGQDKSSARAMQTFKGPVILYVGAAGDWLRKGFIERWHDRILFVYGFDESDFSPTVFSNLGIQYYCIPFASNPDVMKPLNLPKVYDVLFVGNAGSGIGRHNYAEPLIRTLKNYNLQFIGPGWEHCGFPSQSIAWGNTLNILYNLSKICINISNDQEKAGKEKRLDANNRLFDLAMAGCFQISNAPQIVRHYFDESEVIAIDPPDEWVDTIRYYLAHPSEMESFRVAARQRALTEHTWGNRAEKFLEFINNHLPGWRETHVGSSYFRKLTRLRDTSLPPYGLSEAMAKAGRHMDRILRRLR